MRIQICLEDIWKWCCSLAFQLHTCSICKWLSDFEEIFCEIKIRFPLSVKIYQSGSEFPVSVKRVGFWSNRFSVSGSVAHVTRFLMEQKKRKREVRSRLFPEETTEESVLEWLQKNEQLLKQEWSSRYEKVLVLNPPEEDPKETKIETVLPLQKL